MKDFKSGKWKNVAMALLAFADHGAEFYLGSGNDAARAIELARINVANRPTLRALKQAQATALASGDIHVAAEPRMQASGGEHPAIS
jgi:hypothetical protein